MKRRLLYVPALVLVGAALWLYRATRPDAVVDVIRPTVGAIRAYVEEQAVTELPTDYLVSMPINGWLQRIDLREGDTVKQDEVVASLEKEDLVDRVRQAEQRIAVLETNIKENQDNRLELNTLVQANATVKAINETVQAAEKKLEASKAVSDFAHSEVDRVRKLKEVSAVAEQELRSTETNWRKATADMQSDALQLAALKTLAAVSYIGPKLVTDYIDRKSFTHQSYEKQLEEARAQLEIEKRNLARTEMRSPVSGVVLKCNQTRRQFLSAGTPLLTLGKLDDMQVRAEVLTERAMHISPGNAVEITGEGLPDGILEGKVKRVDPAGFKKISSLGVEQQRVNVIISIARRPERLGVDFRVNVRIIYDEQRDALTLPRTAVFRAMDGGWQVMTVRNGYTQLAPIRIGLMNEDRAVILDGLTPTDIVITHPAREIIPNLRVTTRPAG